MCDPDCFDTLSDSLFADGAAESIKYGIISDESLFEIFESGDVKGNIESIVRRCVEIKSDIVSRDEFDTGERQKLNLGHTLGHAQFAPASRRKSSACAKIIYRSA